MNSLRTLLFVAFIFLVQGQPAASLQGNVVDPETGPLSKAIVELMKADSVSPLGTVTETDGKFVFRNLPPGQYRLVATRPGYVRLEYGQRRPDGGGLIIVLAAGQQRTNATLALTPTVAVHGRIYDRAGRPLANATVQAVRPMYQDGRRVLTFEQATITNDLGEYRLFWMSPGAYYISAMPANTQQPPGWTGPIVPLPDAGDGVGASVARVGTAVTLHRDDLSAGEAYAPVYYPGTIDEQFATLLELKGRADVAADFTVAPVAVQQIRGVIVNASTGQPIRGGAELAMSRIPALAGTPFYAVVDFDDGTFEISPVVPGRYVLAATASDMTGHGVIDVGDAPIENVRIPVSAGINVSGRIRIEGTPATSGAPNASGLFVTLQLDPLLPGIDPPFAVSSVNGFFSLRTVPLGEYRVEVRGLPPDPNSPPSTRNVPASLPGGYLKSIRLGAIDVLNQGLRIGGPLRDSLEIVIGTNASVLEGQILNDRREGDANVSVVLIPETSRELRPDLFRATSTDAFGKFILPSIPPGDYRVFAWDDVEPGAWLDPQFLRQYESRGKAVHIGEGRKETIEVIAIQ